jgi:hypothetical protein
MSAIDMIAGGVGFAPGSARFIITKGLGLGGSPIPEPPEPSAEDDMHHWNAARARRGRRREQVVVAQPLDIPAPHQPPPELVEKIAAQLRNPRGRSMPRRRPSFSGGVTLE